MSEILDDSGGTWTNKKDEKNEECFDRSVYKNQWMGVRLYGNLSMMFWVEMCL